MFSFLSHLKDSDLVNHELFSVFNIFIIDSTEKYLVRRKSATFNAADSQPVKDPFLVIET